MSCGDYFHPLESIVILSFHWYKIAEMSIRHKQTYLELKFCEVRNFPMHQKTNLTIYDPNIRKKREKLTWKVKRCFLKVQKL